MTKLIKHDIFSTPVWHIKGARQSLVDELYEKVATIKEKKHLFNVNVVDVEPGSADDMRDSNQGGYQTSQADWKSFHPDGIEYIEKLVTDIFVDYSVEVSGWWYNINPQGAWNLPHSHGGADYALIWYLTDSDGLLQLMNPHSYRIDCRDGWFDTKKGDVLIFPGDIIHYVMPNTKEKDRVCISMNLKLYNHSHLQLS